MIGNVQKGIFTTYFVFTAKTVEFFLFFFFFTSGKRSPSYRRSLFLRSLQQYIRDGRITTCYTYTCSRMNKASSRWSSKVHRGHLVIPACPYGVVSRTLQRLAVSHNPLPRQRQRYFAQHKTDVDNQLSALYPHTD
jgi:hypothetical protein